MNKDGKVGIRKVREDLKEIMDSVMELAEADTEGDEIDVYVLEEVAIDTITDYIQCNFGPFDDEVIDIRE